MNVDIKVEGVEKALKRLDPQVVTRASVRAVNDVAKQGTAEAKRQIATRYNIKPGRIAEFLRISVRASGALIQAVISGKGIGIALSYFGAKQEGVRINKNEFRYTRKSKTKGWQRRGGEVTVLVKRSHGRKTVTTDPKAFMIRLKSGHIAVMQRRGQERLPLKQLYGPGVGMLFGSRYVMEPTKAVIKEKFTSRFKYWLDRYRGGAR